MFSPSQNGDEQDKRQQVRQEIRELVHQVDTQLVVFDPDVDMHAADQQTPGRRLHLGRQRVVALSFGMFLVQPACVRMGRSRHRREPVAARDFHDRRAQVSEL